MVIKNFQAASIQDALDLVRKEFGAEAVILKTDVLRQNGARLFSVTAARDYDTNPKSAKSSNNSKSVTNRLVPSDDSATSPSRLESALLDVVIPELLTGEIKQTYLALRSHDVESQLSLDICRRLQRAENPGRETLLQIFEAISPQPIDLPEAHSNIVFVGPCGSGKSSILAKLATEYVFHRKQKVTLETLDNFRPGAEEEIANLTDILELASSQSKSNQGTKQLGHHLIDTTGIVCGDVESLDAVANQISHVPNRFTVLVMSLTTGWAHIRKYIDFARPLGIDAIALTQLDATESCGTMLNLAVGSYPPVLCLTDSRLPNTVIYNFDVKLCLGKLVGELHAE